MKFRYFLLFFLSSFCVNGQFDYELDWKKEGIIFGGAGLMAGSSFLIDNTRDPISLDEILNSSPSINKFDRFALGNSSLKAKNASDVLFYISSAIPILILASDKVREKELHYLLMLGETVALNGGLTFLVKSATKRKRPYFYNTTFSIEDRQVLDARKSFFSGHVSHSAALSFFTASVFSDLYPESPWKYAVWSGAITVPATIAALRVQAGRHFPTDVLVGYGVGAGIGLLIPYLHKSNYDKDSVLNISPTFNGFVLTYKL